MPKGLNWRCYLGTEKMKSVTWVFLFLPPFYQNVSTDPNTYNQLKWKCQGDEFVLNILHTCKSYCHGPFLSSLCSFSKSTQKHKKLSFRTDTAEQSLTGFKRLDANKVTAVCNNREDVHECLQFNSSFMFFNISLTPFNIIQNNLFLALH